MIKRERFLVAIRPFFDSPDLVKVVTGIRRAGKSVLLMQIADELRASGVPDVHIIPINLELLEFAELRSAKALHDHIRNRITSQGMFYVFLDEVQNVEEFELAVNSLRAMGNVSIFMTGSNAHLLSGELATHLSGRYVQFMVTPFTFSEVMEVHANSGTSPKEVFDDFFQWGSLPGRFAFKGSAETQKYLQDVYDSVMLRDIVQRAGIRDIRLLENIIQFLLDNIGRIFSASTVSKYLKSQNRSVSPETLYNHIHRVIGSLLFTKVDRYDIKGKSLFSTFEKYYIADIGLLQAKRSGVGGDIGGRLENIVANELIARGYRINVGALRDAEIDFVAERNGDIEYIQVAYAINSDETAQREFGALDKIRDHHRKTVITTDTFDHGRNGIRHVNIIDWLLEHDSFNP